MPARAHWKGYLKLSLVSCPIALYPAISAAEKISFRQVNRQTGNRLRHQLVDIGTGEVVQPSDRGRGYEVGEQEYLVVEEQELEQAREEARARPFTAPPVAFASRAPTVPPQAHPAFENRVSRKDSRVEPPPAARVELLYSPQLAAAKDREQPDHPDRPLRKRGRRGPALLPDTLLHRTAGSGRRGVLRCDTSGDGGRGRRRYGPRCAR